MAGRSLILAIETATGCGSVSLTRGGVEDGRLLAEATVQPEVTHSRRLLGSVDWIMKGAGVEWADVDGVAVSLGPGSFTGLRIGMAAAKGIVFTTKVPFLGVQTLDAISLSCPIIDRPLWCLLDARKQEVYAACYQPDNNGRPQRITPAEVIRPDILADRIQEPVILAGPGVDEYYDLFATIESVQLIPAVLSSPRAARVGFLAAEQMAAGETMDPATAAPLYVRASEAEINLQKQGRGKRE
ncbi:MAG: tRNA (adenosine(37)-N6)-threonylcarbamoyltransferase complex dimerization subunit type 1 TsaB [Thermodesulfobacteriota bacterium]|nr:tRNA (adenosine(37)-N6)-threonylcarbamoyltransferase complex dimerization subunit type 1 TsaB [Thermodesulfobacteriota bacterium]